MQDKLTATFIMPKCEASAKRNLFLNTEPIIAWQKKFRFEPASKLLIKINELILNKILSIYMINDK